MTILPGTLELLILRALLRGPCHGYGVIRWLRRASGDVLGIEEGALYPALHRLEERGWLSASWGLSPRGREAKLYTLTDEGRRRLDAETDSWRRYVAVVDRVLDTA